jgi:ABC-type polysaccharide/polyol phosphate export permease
MANLLENYRQVLMDGNSPDWLALGLIALTSTFVIYLMLLLYRKLDTKYAMMLSQ